MSITLERAFPAFKGGMLPIPRGRSGHEILRDDSPTRAVPLPRQVPATSMKFRQDRIYLSETSPRSIEVYRSDSVSTMSDRYRFSSRSSSSLSAQSPARSPTRSFSRINRSPVFWDRSHAILSPMSLSAHTPAASDWVSLPVEMGLWDCATANVLRHTVAKFSVEQRPLPKRNALLEGPRIPEFEQLRQEYKIPVRRVPYPRKNDLSLEFEPTKMGTEARPKTRTWNTLDVTMASCDIAVRSHEPTLENDIFEWEVDTAEYTAFLMVGEGFFYKNALCNPELVTNFLLDPVAVCKDAFLLQNTHVQDVSVQRGEAAPRPDRMSMSILFSKIHRALEARVEDMEWHRVRRSALRFLLDFAQESSPPHVRIAPVRTMLAVAFFSILLSVDGNVPCSIIVAKKTGSIEVLGETGEIASAIWPPNDPGQSRRKSTKNSVVFQDI